MMYNITLPVPEAEVTATTTVTTIGSTATTHGATTTIGATIAVGPEFIITAAGSAIAGIVVGTIIITITLVTIFVCTRQRKQKIRGHNQWLPRRSHQRTLSSNLIVEQNEPEGRAILVYYNSASASYR